MRLVHLILGWSIILGFASLWLWGLGAWIVRRGTGRYFWWILAYVQAALLVLARDAFAHRPWAPFALAAFFSFGLTLRALMTGG
jgi:hypothetical protein